MEWAMYACMGLCACAGMRKEREACNATVVTVCMYVQVGGLSGETTATIYLRQAMNRSINVTGVYKKQITSQTNE